MKFTDRVQELEAEGAYAMLAEAQALEEEGRSIIHMEVGQPDFPTFPHISLAGIQAIAAGQTGYTPPAGISQLRMAIAEDAGERRGIEVRPEQVLVGPGTKPGMFFPTLALVQPGDEVIYPDPGFPTYSAMARVAGGVPVPVPVREEKDFSFDLEALEERMSSRTKLVILNSPANPTGGVIPQADLERIAELVLAHNCWVMTDEIYARLVYDGLSAPSIASIPGMLERTVIVDGFSKTYSMTGWRLGYAVMPEALAERVNLLLTHSIGCTATFTQIAGITALKGEQGMIAEVVADYQRRRDRIVSGLNAIPGVRCRTPQGAFYVFPNVSSFGLSSKELARKILHEAGIAVLAGNDFGIYGEGYLRLSYATSLENIEMSLDRLVEFFSCL